VTGAASVAVLPFFLRLSELLALALFFTGVLTWTRMRHLLRSVHGIDRASVGALVFPIGLLLAVVFAWGHPAAIAYAALVLGLADPAAALVGKCLTGVGWPVIGGHKTIVGSVTFALVTIAIGLLIGFGGSDVRFLAVLGSAIVLTTVEGSLGYGLDNIPVPAVASVLGVTWLGL
jgi:dolichol kinase